MADRITLTVLSILCLSQATPLLAQGTGVYPASAQYVEPGNYPGADPYAGNGFPGYPMQGYAPQLSPGGYGGGGYGPGYGPGPGGDCYGAPGGPNMGCDPNYMMQEALPADRGFDYGESPLDIFLKQAFRNTYLRLDYMSFRIKDPGNDLLGTPLLDVLPPNTVREPFPVFDPATGNFIGTATVPDISPFELKNINGIRGTLGIELHDHTIEANVWGLEQHDTQFGAFIDNNQSIFVGTSTYTNGQLGNNIELYDSSFNASLRTDVVGTEINLILHDPKPWYGLKVKPMFGFRYINYQERMLQVGVFNQGGSIEDVVTRINSKTSNNVYGPQLGLRIDLEHPWFTIGCEPKIAFALNSFSAEVQTERFRSNDDPTVTTREKDTSFSPVAELNVYGRVHLCDWFSVNVGYNVIFISDATRPYNNIFYNDKGPSPTPAGVVLDNKFQDVWLDGLTVGGELRF